MESTKNTEVAPAADMMEVDEPSTPVRRPIWAAAAAASGDVDQNMADAEALIERAGRGVQDGEAVEDGEEDQEDDEDPMADLEAAANRDDISANGDINELLADVPAEEEEEPPVYIHLVEKTGSTSTSRFVQVEYDPNAIQVTVDANQIVPRIAGNATRPSLDTVHLAHGHTDDEILLGHVAHPDDIAGSLLLHIAPRYSTMELAERINALYHCLKMQLNSNNAFTQRVALAGDHLGTRNGWSKQETGEAKARLRNIRPNAHTTAIPYRQYTFVNRPGGEEAPKKTNWIKPQMRKDAGPEDVSQSSRNRNRNRVPTPQGARTLLPAPQPVADEQADVQERAEEGDGESDEAYTAEELEAGQAHHDPERAARYKYHADQKETLAELKRQLAKQGKGRET